MPDQLPAQQASVHGPYEDAIIAGCGVIEKLIDGQSPAQKQEIWASLIALGRPFVDAAVHILTLRFTPMVAAPKDAGGPNA